MMHRIWWTLGFVLFLWPAVGRSAEADATNARLASPKFVSSVASEGGLASPKFVTSVANEVGQLASQTALVGTVADRDGLVVPGAQVVAVNVGTKDTYETTTNAEGYYNIQFAKSPPAHLPTCLLA